MKRVLALDPGDRVGWAAAHVHDDGTWTELRHGIEDLKAMALCVHRDLNDPGPMPDLPQYDVVVCERWALYATHAKVMIGSEIPSAQFIGMVKLSCWLAGVPLVMQGAAKVNSNKPGVLSPVERMMKKLRPELFERVTQPVAHDDGHDLVAIKHLFGWTVDNYDLRPPKNAGAS